MKKINKLIALFLSCFLLTSVVGCSCNPTPPSNSSSDGGDSSTDSSSADGTIGDAPVEDVVDYTNIKLADNGDSDYTIVIPADADVCVSYAADELQKYFKESTTAEIPIVDDSSVTLSADSKYISLGDTTLKTAAGVSVTREEVNQDGFKMIRSDSNMIIASFEPRGVLYGAYEFLHKAFGYECYAADEYEIRQNTTAYLPDVNYTDVPSFRGRWFDGEIDSQQVLHGKLRLKSGRTKEMYGGSAGDEWIGGFHCESMHYLIDPNGEIAEGNVEKWFAKGRFDTATQKWKGGHWCYTNASLQKTVAQVVIEYLKNDPDLTIVNFGEEDMDTLCDCTRAEDSYCNMGCKDSYKLYSVSGTLIRFLNPIIEEIEAWVAENQPGRYLEYVTFAYHASIVPPVNSTADGGYELKDPSCQPHDKLYIRYAPIERCLYHSYADESCKMNDRWSSAWKGWTAITDKFMVWDYNINFSSEYLQFFDRFSALQREYKEYHDKGVVNMIIQYNNGGNIASMNNLMNYLMAKLMWNVNVDVNALINNFMNHYYKEAAPYMKQYLNMMRSHTATMDAELGVNTNVSEQFHMAMYNTSANVLYRTAKVWPIRVLEQASDLLNQAATAAGDNNSLRLRILKESLCVRYMILRNYKDYYNPASKDYPTMINQWENDAKVLGLNIHREGAANYNELLELWRSEIQN